jgi:hypothetical protein
MKRIFRKTFSFVLVILIFSSCIQENPDLVNPPLIVETVNIRFLNLSGDEQPRTLILDRKSISENQIFNTMSAPDTPPYDSVTIQVFKNDFKTYSTIQKFKFARISNYIMIALPNYNNPIDSIDKNEDTIIYLQTTILKPNDTNQCYIKFVNCNPDTSINYSIKVGCPNGENLFVDNGIMSVRYLQNTGTQAIYEGKRVISIIKNFNSTSSDPDSASTPPKLIGIFELDLKNLQQYALIINKYDEVFFVSELDANSPLQKLNSVAERNAFVRVINLSTEII